MSTWQSVIGIIAGLLSFFCFIPYIITILRHQTRPNRVTWWIWATNGAILSVSYHFAGAGNTIWLIVFPVIAQTIIAILSIKYGKGGWSRFDRACLLGAGLGLLLWWQFHSPLIAIISTITIDLLGALPTIKKSYAEPETENLLTWSIYLMASILNLSVIEDWSFMIVIPPLYVFCLNLLMVALLLWARSRNSLAPSRKIRL